MNTGSRKNDRPACRLVTAIAVLVVATACSSAEPVAYDLLIERSPVAAGTVRPGVGMHRYSANSMVSLRAQPERGYRFAYWLGEVSDTTAERTTVRVDAHKVVVAVFQPEPRQHLEEQLVASGGGDGFMIASPTDLGTPSWSRTGRGKPGTITPPAIRPEIVTPEPGTIAFLALGYLYVRRGRR
jgi:hypothetical protein